MHWACPDCPSPLFLGPGRALNGRYHRSRSGGRGEVENEPQLSSLWSGLVAGCTIVVSFPPSMSASLFCYFRPSRSLVRFTAAERERQTNASDLVLRGHSNGRRRRQRSGPAESVECVCKTNGNSGPKRLNWRGTRGTIQ